jgi:hypothetical protein
MSRILGWVAYCDCGDSIAWRSLRPLPCSLRSITPSAPLRT